MRRSIDYASNVSRSDAFYTVMWAGLISGLLDGIAACTVFYLKQGFSPAEVMKFIATGVYGAKAFTGGPAMVVVGISLHFFIAFVISWVYFAVFPNFRVLNSKPVLSGFVFGALVWIVMNVIVIPLTQVPPAPFEAKAVMVSLVWHMILVGLPISIITKKAFNNK